jgi:hypothetical protein
MDEGIPSLLTVGVAEVDAEQCMLLLTRLLECLAARQQILSLHFMVVFPGKCASTSMD